jgi:serine/threonine protein kinase/tetratricopeptide (TPR) repeat protein
MTSARWDLVTKIFDAALDQPERARNDFVRRECKGDQELEAEVLRLLAADQQAGSFLEHPALTTVAARSVFQPPPSLLAAGSVISGRFEILRFIGQGGMGQVYEALDLELKERVALKAIRPDISSDPRMLSRFRREVQLTRRITHPNVCRTFDIERQSSSADDGTRGDLTFLTMELLEGETLSDLLRRDGRLTTTAALPLVLQMIEALSAAHSVGIIHRDFKPSNVLLVPSDTSASATLRVVVTDFGLARALVPDGQISSEHPATSLTDNQALMGTLVYMAPEQFERGEATVASDIYSLGLVMYEMVTGARPFADPIPFAEAAKRLKQPAPSPKLLAPDLEPAWEAAINKCLETEPQARFQAAGQVAEEIAYGNASTFQSTWHRRRPKQARKVFPLSPKRGRSWRMWTGIAMLTAIVALFVLGFRYYRWSATVPEGALVLLTEIANQTSEQDLDATTDVVLHELNQSAHFNVIERSKVREVVRQMGRPYQQQLDPAMAREVAWRAGGVLIVYGTISRLGPALSLDLRLEKLGKLPKDSPRSWFKSFQANDKQDLFSAIQAGSQWIREMAGENADLFTKEKPPQDTTTTSWEALLLYSQAEQLKALEHTPEAIERLQQAVNTDPNFALAWMRLGDLSNSIERDGDAFRFWRKALDAMQQRPLTKREELRIKGLYADDTADYATSRQVFQEWEVLYPKDYLPSFYLAGALSGAGRYQEAVDKLNEAERKQPGAWYIAARRMHCNFAMGRFDRLSPDLKRLHELGEEETGVMLQGALDFINGNYDSALQHFKKLANSTDDYWKSLSYSIIASFLSEQGRYTEAKSLLLEGIEFDAAKQRAGSLADKEIELAYLAFRTGDLNGCKKASLDAVDKEDGPVHVKMAGSMLARCGFTNDALRIEAKIKPLLDGSAFQIARNQIEGEVYLARGNASKAIAKFELEANLESPASPKEYLARALLAAGRKDESLHFYTQIVDAAGQIWQEPDIDPPGLWADALFQSARLDDELRHTDAGLRRYVEIRGKADPSLMEVGVAKQMLRGLDGTRILQ